MKRIISSILAFAMMATMLQTIAFATGMSISGEQDVVPVYYDENQYYAKVAFNVADAEPISAAALEFTVPDEFTVVGITAGASVTALQDTFGNDLYSFTNGLSGNQNTVVINMLGVDQIMSDGVLMYIQVLIPNTITNGEYEIGLKKTNDLPGNISNVAGNNIECSFTPATINVTNGITETYSVDFYNDTEKLSSVTDVVVGNEPTDMPTATKNADADGTTYVFSHWSKETDGEAVDWASYVSGDTATVYAVFTTVAPNYGNVDYTITTTLDAEEYRSGETITATVSVTAEDGSNIGSFDIQDIVYDADYVTLESITAATGLTSGMTIGTEKVGYIHGDNTTGLAIGTTATDLFTITFTANDDVATDSTTISVDDIYMTSVGVNGNSGDIEIVDATAKIIDTVKITLSASDNGSYTGTESFTMDSGKTLADVKGMGGYVDPEPNTNYVWTGWYDSNNTLLDDTYEFTTDTAITAKFAAGSFAFAGDSTNNTDVKITPSIGFTTDNKVTYLTDATFTVEAPDGYVLNGVSYKVGTDETAITLTATSSTATSGSYKIDGSSITGDITIVVSVVEYHTVKFQSGDGSTMDTVTYYTREGTSNTGLYASLTEIVSGVSTATEPSYSVLSGYRISSSPWITDDTATTFAAIQQADITEDTVYTVNTIKTYEIEFAAGDNGTVVNTYNGTYDTGATVTVPTPEPATGFEFAGWDSSTEIDLADSAGSFEATEDVKYTATFTEGTYSVAFPTVEGATFTDITGLAGSETDGYTATYNQSDDVSFTIEAPDLQIDSVSYSVDGGAPVVIEAVSGVYTIPSSEITGAVSITVSATDIYTVSFTTDADSHGKVTGTASFNVVKGNSLGTTEFANVVVTPDTGYKFDGWYIDEALYENPENEVVTGDVTYTAKFSQIYYTFTGVDDYTITWDDTYTANEYAIYNQNVTFTISSDSSIVTGMKLGDTDLVADTDGVYTISGSLICGDDDEIALTPVIITGQITFIDLDSEYLADVNEAANRKIMLLSSTTETDGSVTYKLSNDITLWWSSVYSAYVTIVDDVETVDTLSYGMTSDSDTTATAISYEGDLNSDGSVRSDDVGMVNDILHGARTVTTTDMQMLMADIKGTKYLATDDVTTVMNDVLGIS